MGRAGLAVLLLYREASVTALNGLPFGSGAGKLRLLQDFEDDDFGSGSQSGSWSPSAELATVVIGYTSFEEPMATSYSRRTAYLDTIDVASDHWWVPPTLASLRFCDAA